MHWDCATWNRESGDFVHPLNTHGYSAYVHLLVCTRMCNVMVYLLYVCNVLNVPIQLMRVCVYVCAATVCLQIYQLWWWIQLVCVQSQPTGTASVYTSVMTVSSWLGWLCVYVCVYSRGVQAPCPCMPAALVNYSICMCNALFLHSSKSTSLSLHCLCFPVGCSCLLQFPPNFQILLLSACSGEHWINGESTQQSASLSVSEGALCGFQCLCWLHWQQLPAVEDATQSIWGSAGGSSTQYTPWRHLQTCIAKISVPTVCNGERWLGQTCVCDVPALG